MERHVRLGLEVVDPARVRRLGEPEMTMRPSMLWKTSSMRRALPVRRPFVVMSIV
jgi:hypothetical protein